MNSIYVGTNVSEMFNAINSSRTKEFIIQYNLNRGSEVTIYPTTPRKAERLIQTLAEENGCSGVFYRRFSRFRKCSEADFNSWLVKEVEMYLLINNHIEALIKFFKENEKPIDKQK